MKKKLVYSTLLLLFITYGIYWFRYERAFSSLKTVPKETIAVFQINLRNIEQSFLLDFLKNPLLYTKKKDSLQAKKKHPSLISLLKFPRNLILYATDSCQLPVFYSEPVQVKDTVAFHDFLTNNNYKEIGVNSGFASIYSKNHHSFILKESTLTIGLHSTKTLSQINIKNVYPSVENNVEVKKIFNFDYTTDLQFWNQNTGVFSGDFSNGCIRFKSDAYSDLGTISKKYKNAVAYIDGNLKIIPFLQDPITAEKRAFKKLTNTSLDSINKYWTGNIQLIFHDFKTITDTIISYDYDENFNQLEKKKLQQRTIPHLSLNFGKRNPSELWSYFKKNNTFKQVKKDSLFTLIPLLPLKSTFLNEQYFFYTDTIIKPLPSTMDTKGLHFFINIAPFINNTPWDVFKNKQLQQLHSINGNINQKNQFNIRINCKNKQRNGLIQLLKN